MNYADFDVIIIGSGFGGSVSALRLAEKGYRVAVMEQGRRWSPENLPPSNWHVRRYIWRPALGLRGFFNMRFFRHMVVVHGCAVGGGSITYAQTLWQPKDSIWQAGEWASLADWRAFMPQHYATAKRMLGAQINQRPAWADAQLQAMAQASGVAEQFYHTEVGVFFGDGTRPQGASYPDPYFDGKGPPRNSCIGCGGCMVGCKYNAKNTLDKNYLYLAEQLGVRVLSETQVVQVSPLQNSDGRDGYAVHTRSSRWGRRARRVWTADKVIFAAGSLGTQELLFKMKDAGHLPKISNQLGHKVRTNAESLIGVRYLNAAPEQDYSTGVAIGSGVFIDEHTHIEATRYPKGSDALYALITLMHAGRSRGGRIANWLSAFVRYPVHLMRLSWPFGAARETMILLCMQTLEGHLTMTYRAPWYWPWAKKMQTTGAKIPTRIDSANEFARKGAQVTGGTAVMTLVELLLDVPMTAHCLGGAVMGADASVGVCDAQLRVFGYENLWICDGSVIAANLGVNPSLTIVALAEYAMSQIPSKERT
ncbi:MAG: GMC oxidoreductase [Formosimonas sp.]